MEHVAKRLPRVLHILFGGLGGHGSVVFSLIRASQDEADHSLLFVGTGALLPTYEERSKQEGTPYRYERTKGGLDLGFQRRVFARIRAEHPDVVAVHSSGSLVPAIAIKLRRPRTRVVLIEHQSWALRSRRHALATHLALLAADHLIVLSDDDQARMKYRGHRLLHRAQVSRAVNGIDVERFAPATKRTSRGNMIRIGMQSRVIPIKDHPTLLRATALLRNKHGLNVALSIAGDGSSRPAMAALTSELGLDGVVSFTGTLGERELVKFLQSLDIYVHATLGEAMSTALLQAFACQLPAVASDVPGVGDQFGSAGIVVLVPAQDAEEMAAALAGLAADDARRAELGAAARALVVDKYDLRRMWATYRPGLLGPDSERLAPSPLATLLERTFGTQSPPIALRAWPSARAPRIAFPASDREMARWFQRVGLLGGGSGPVVRSWWRRLPIGMLLAARKVQERVRRGG